MGNPILAILSAVLVLAVFASDRGAEKGCPAYTTVTFRLDRAKGSLERIAVSKVGERICGTLPVAGDENARLEIERDGKVVFTRPVHLMTSVQFDLAQGTGPDQKLTGGRFDEPAPLILALLPIEPLKAKPEPVVRLVDSSGKVLGSTR